MGVPKREAEVADVRGAIGGDDHVVAPTGRDRRQVGVLARSHRRARAGARAVTPSPPRAGDRRAANRGRSGGRRARARRFARRRHRRSTRCAGGSPRTRAGRRASVVPPRIRCRSRTQGARTRGEPTALQSPHACCRVERGPRARGQRTSPIPTPGPGELVLEVTACGICGSDLKMRPSMPAGLVMGHEFCGEIVGDRRRHRSRRGGWAAT